MGRKIKFDKNCGSKFITIDDEKKWELIREIATVKRYESSFNAIVNDALAFGLPELHKRLFDKVQLDGEEKAGLACGTENCWAVNSQASEEDIQATLDFIYWVVTSDEGTQMMAEQFGPIPFKNAKESENVFFNDANEYMANGNYTVT